MPRQSLSAYCTLTFGKRSVRLRAVLAVAFDTAADQVGAGRVGAGDVGSDRVGVGDVDADGVGVVDVDAGENGAGVGCGADVGFYGVGSGDVGAGVDGADVGGSGAVDSADSAVPGPVFDVGGGEIAVGADGVDYSLFAAGSVCDCVAVVVDGSDGAPCGGPEHSPMTLHVNKHFYHCCFW